MRRPFGGFAATAASEWQLFEAPGVYFVPRRCVVANKDVNADHIDVDVCHQLLEVFLENRLNRPINSACVEVARVQLLPFFQSSSNMWRTPDGERTLQGAEAKLFREALGMLVDAVRDDDDGSIWNFGISAFDELRQVQKLAVLYEVGKTLLKEDVPAPAPVAYREAAVAAVYEHLHNLVEIEIDRPEMRARPSWRDLILQACIEQGIGEDLPEPECDDVEEWVLVIEVLADGVLWDRDFLDSDFHLDVDPKNGRKLKQVLGINARYFTAVPPDPEDKEMPRVLAALRTLYQGER